MVGDAEAMARLSTELGYAADTAVMAKRIEAVLASSADFLVVAIASSDEICGFLQAHASTVIESGFRVEIMGLIVAGSARRQAVGRALVADAEQWAKNLSAPVMVVRSNIVRMESHQFYPALRYEATKTQQIYRKRLRD